MQQLLRLAAFLASLLSAASAAAALEPDPFTAALAKGPLFAAMAALVGGFLVALTPCVYPMIAVTVSVFGARQARSRWEGAALSSAFVAGMVAMFVPLGVAAGLTGSVFGAVLQSRGVVVAVSALFLLMAAAMFGAFELALPSALTNRLVRVGGIGYRGAFLLGLVCGLIASPCTGPVLTGILAYIAQTQDAAMGAVAMAAFSLGLGAPFFVVGAFAVQLPKSGPWMVKVKSLLGLVLVVVALYFLGTTFSQLTAWAHSSPWLWVVCGTALVTGLLMGAVHRDFSDPTRANRVFKAGGIVLVSLAAFWMLSAATKPRRTLEWATGGVDRAQALAKDERRPMLVDFTAAWCGACKELDRITFSDPRISERASRFVAVKVDATRDDEPAVQRALEQFGVRGLPTVLLIDADGREVRRFTDFVDPDEFLEALQAVD